MKYYWKSAASGDFLRDMMKPLDEIFPEMDDLVPARVTPKLHACKPSTNLHNSNYYARNEAAAQGPIDTGNRFCVLGLETTNGG